MDHLAILDAKRHLLDKILTGEKTVESRWYVQRRAPYQAIARGDTVYFKESGKVVTAKATVARALFFDDLTPGKIHDILREHGKAIGFDENSAQQAVARNREKKYCTLVFLDDVRRITPFAVDKRGYGMMSAWITVEDIASLKKTL